MPRKKENRQADGGQRRNLIRLGPDLFTVPQMARQYSAGALHVMTCIMHGRDPDSVAIGSTEEEIMTDGERLVGDQAIPWKDRMRGAETVLNRAVGKPLDFQSMREIEKIERSSSLDYTTEELLAFIDGYTGEEVTIDQN